MQQPIQPGPRQISPGERVAVPLKHPIQAHGETVTELRLRRPTAGDLEATDGLGEIAKINKLIERCAGIPRSSVQSIDADDLPAVAEVVGSFFESSRASGEST